jgi:hypothetical protein
VQQQQSIAIRLEWEDCSFLQYPLRLAYP